MEKLKIAQVARELGITPTAVYRKVKACSEQVHGAIVKEKGITYLSRAGVEALRATMQKPAPERVSPGSEPVQNQVQTLERQVEEQRGIIQGLQKTLDSLVASHADERARADTIIMQLSRDVGGLKKALEDKRPAAIPADPPRPVHPWKPEPHPDPREGLGFLERLWVEWFHPERLRRWAS